METSKRRIDQKTREQSLYWKSLSPIFKVDLHGDFHSRIEIPQYFCHNVKGRLPRTVTVKGPSTDIDVWEVDITTTTNTAWLNGEDWRNFANAFSLEENDSLVFKYKNNSYFKVKVISGKTSCEKESSRFVTDGAPKLIEKEPEVEKKGADGSSKERISGPILLPFIKEESISHDEMIPPELTESGGSPYTESRKRNAEAIAPPGYVANIRVKTEDMSSPCQSNRKEISMQIELARQKAKTMQKFSDNSFCVSLSRTHVLGLMKLGIPRQWWETEIKSKNDQNIQLHCEGDDQSRSYVCFCVYDESKRTATLTSGWRKFVLDKGLCECDSCLFKLAKPWKEGDVIHLEVEIIRGIEGKSFGQVNA